MNYPRFNETTLKDIFQIIQIWQNTQSELAEREIFKLLAKILKFSQRVGNIVEQTPPIPTNISKSTQTANCRNCRETGEISAILKDNINKIIVEINDLLEETDADLPHISQLTDHVYAELETGKNETK